MSQKNNVQNILQPVPPSLSSFLFSPRISGPPGIAKKVPAKTHSWERREKREGNNATFISIHSEFKQSILQEFQENYTQYGYKWDAAK